MTILKKIILLLCIGIIYPDIDTEIQDNEKVIDALQKVLEKDSTNEALQNHVEKVIKEQNALLARKASGASAKKSDIADDATPTNDKSDDKSLESKIRHIVREELAAAKNNNRAPTEAETRATKAAEANAPQLPEEKSEAMSQYNQSIGLFEKGEYKLAAAGFGRIIKNHKEDKDNPIVAKAMVNLALCLEKQGELDSAAVVCKSVLEKNPSKLSDSHKTTCNEILKKAAKTTDSSKNKKPLDDAKNKDSEKKAKVNAPSTDASKQVLKVPDPIGVVED